MTAKTKRNHKNNNNVHVLLISGQSSDIHEVKQYLFTSSELTYHVEHRPDFFGSSDLLTDGQTNIDVILLDLGMFGSEHSREIFRRMVDMAHGIPIIVFTNRKDHDMALWAMEDGASDNITRGNAGTDIFKFRDAISFSLARAEVARKLEERTQEDVARTNLKMSEDMRDSEQKSTNAMDRQKNHYASMVRKVIEKGDEDVFLAVREISEALEHARFENKILLAQLKKQEEAESPDTV